MYKRQLWDNYYVPMVQGWFSDQGKFRSDAVKTGNLICFVGSSTSVVYLSLIHISRNPQGTLVTVSYASFSAVLNMACLVAIGYAFGCTDVAALVAAFAVAAISVILSPTPQGVGVVEAAIAAILTAQGCLLYTSTRCVPSTPTSWAGSTCRGPR